MLNETTSLPKELENKIIKSYNSLKEKDTSHSLLDLVYILKDSILSVTRDFAQRYKRDIDKSPLCRFQAYYNDLEAAVKSSKST